MAKDRTQKEVLIAIETELFGINGSGGMRDDIKEVKKVGEDGRKKLHARIDQSEEKLTQKIDEAEDKIEILAENCVTKEDCAKVRAQPAINKVERIKIRAAELAAFGAVIGAIYGIVQLIKALTG